MALAAGPASVNSLATDGLVDRRHLQQQQQQQQQQRQQQQQHSQYMDAQGRGAGATTSSARATTSENRQLRHSTNQNANDDNHTTGSWDTATGAAQQQQQQQQEAPPQPKTCRSVTGAPLDLQWRQMQKVEYLTDGGNSWIHTAVYDGNPVAIKTLKPECQDVALAINEIEAELKIHSQLQHPNICSLIGGGTTSNGVRFVVLERLDGGTLTQTLGYDTRIRDRRRRFWKRKQFSFVDVLRVARSIADAMAYLHEEAVPSSIVLHRDLKPDNIGTCAQLLYIAYYVLCRMDRHKLRLCRIVVESIDRSAQFQKHFLGECTTSKYCIIINQLSCSHPFVFLSVFVAVHAHLVCFHAFFHQPGFTLNGTVKILDFGLAKIIENASVHSNETYKMSGETGSLRYMAPEVADGLPYNYLADVYSFGIILWEVTAHKKPFEGLNRELFYERVVHGGERPPLSKKWPKELTSLMSECWDADMQNRPNFRDIVKRLDSMLSKEKGGSGNIGGDSSSKNRKSLVPRLQGIMNRHSTWF